MINRKQDATQKEKRQDPYEILGIPKNASLAEIKKAYKKLALHFHPDKVEDETQKAEAKNKFTAVYDAYLQLTSDITTNNETKYLKDAACQIIGDPIEEHETLYDFCLQKIDKNFLKKQTFSKIDLSDIDLSGVDISTFKKNNFQSIKKKLPLPYQQLHLEDLTPENISALIDQAKQRYKDISNNLDEYSYLWIAQKKGCGPIYIFNTMHVILPAMNRFKDALENMIEKSDVVFTEIAIHETFDSTLPSNYSILDAYIANRAHHMKKTLRPLENAATRQICGLHMSNNEIKLIIKLLEQLKLDYQNSPDLFEAKILQWMLGMTDLTIETTSTVNRNLFWMPSILHSSTVEKNATFVACGALHNVGQFGLPNLLRYEGYEVKPVMKNPPTLTAAALKKTLAQQSGLFAARSENKPVSDDEQTTMKKKR